MKMQFTTGLKWVAVLGLGMALAGLVGCGGSSSGDGGDGSGGGAYQGTYAGGFNGTDEGTMAFTVDGNGILAGTAYSTVDDINYVISGDVNEAGFVSAGAYSGGVYSGTYEGTIDAGGAVRGTWTNESGTDRGTFAAQRM
jgi:hypothetical protein